MKSFFFFLFFIIGQVSAQELIFDNKVLYNDEPMHLYPFMPNSDDILKDFITKDSSYNLKFSNTDDPVSVSSRTYNNSAISLNGSDAKLSLPASITNSLISLKQGFTISGWFRISDPTHNAIGYIGGDTSANIDFFIRDSTIIVRKRSKIDASKMLPVIAMDFPLPTGTVMPAPGDITNGYVYFALTSDNKTTRIFLSGPGGRLFTKWFYFSLTDALKNNDQIHFGRSPDIASDYKLMSAYDDIMVYKKALSPNDAGNAFYQQSPLYPGVSYQLQNSSGQVLAPETYSNHTTPFNDDWYKWRTPGTADTGGPFSSERWFIETQPKSNNDPYVPVTLRNARAGGYVYQKNDSYYYYQLLLPASNFVDRTTFFMQRLDDPLSLYRVDAGKIRFWSKNDPRYWLGKNNDYLYIDNNEVNGNWRVTAATKSYRGAEREPANAGSVVRLRNLGGRMIAGEGNRAYMNTYAGVSYYYMKLDEYYILHSDISNVDKFTLKKQSSSDYNVYTKYKINNPNGILQSYQGALNTIEDDYVITYSKDFDWELVAVDVPHVPKNAVGDRTFYVIRTNNGHGTFLLGRKNSFCPGGDSTCWVLKSGAGAYDLNGLPTREFLWIIDYDHNITQ